MRQSDSKQTQIRHGRNSFAPGNTAGKRFKKGESGNPNGRPKQTALTLALRDRLAMELPGKSETTYAMLITDILIERAMAGDVSAIKECFDRSEGKPKQKVDVDMNVSDLRQMAIQNGVTEDDIIRETRQLFAESDSD